MASEITTKRSYILSLDTMMNVKLNLNNGFERFRQEGVGFLYDIRPNITLSNRISFSYRFISFGIGFKPKFIPGNNDNDKQGKTKARSFDFTINGTHLIQSLYTGKIKGFYLYNTEDFDPGGIRDNEPYLQLPNLKLFELKGATSYKFNANYSIKAISTQTEMQIKSCGSLIPSLTYSYYQIDNGSGSTDGLSSQKSNNYKMILSAGYFYTLVLNSKLYAAGGISPGIGFRYTNLITRTVNGNHTTNYTDPVFQFQERIGVGYNSKKIFAGGELSMAQSKSKMNQTSVQLMASRFYFQVFIGYRFKTPGFIKKETDAAKSLLPKPLKNIIE